MFENSNGNVFKNIWHNFKILKNDLLSNHPYYVINSFFSKLIFPGFIFYNIKN